MQLCPEQQTQHWSLSAEMCLRHHNQKWNPVSDILIMESDEIVSDQKTMKASCCSFKGTCIRFLLFLAGNRYTCLKVMNRPGKGWEHLELVQQCFFFYLEKHKRDFLPPPPPNLYSYKYCSISSITSSSEAPFPIFKTTWLYPAVLYDTTSLQWCNFVWRIQCLLCKI